MRKLILFIATSLDGFIARKDGSIDWLPGSGVEGSEEIENATEDHGYEDLMKRTDVLIMGRKTYKQILTFGDWQFSNKKCYVCTNKKLKEDKNVEFSSDPISLIKDLKSKEGKDIWLVGGGILNGSLLNKNLIDEIIITIIPTIIGEGTKLFENINKDIKLKLIENKKFNSGLIQIKYEIR